MYAGIDIGTGSIKIAWDCGGKITIDKKPYPPDVISGTIHRSYPFIDHMRGIFSHLQKESREAGEPIRGIALDSHGPSLLLMTEGGKSISDIYTWQDNRALPIADEFKSSGIGTGKKELGYETKAAWLYRSYKNRISPKVSKIFSPKDFVVFLLTGEELTDRASAKTILYYDSEIGSRAARCAGLPEDLLPRVIEPWETAGLTGTAFSRSVGLPDGIPVAGGGIDAWCEALGAGAVNEGDIVEGTGTSTCLTMCRTRGSGMNYHVVPHMDMDIETLSFTGGSLLWALDLLKEERSFFDEIDLSQPSSLLFLPYLVGERSPVWDPDASGVCVGLRNTTKGEEFLRGVVQGVSFSIRENLELLSQRSVNTHTAVRAVGGANSSSPWIQQKATITGRVYHKMSVLDSAPFGAWLLAAFGGGEGSFEDMSNKYNGVTEVFYPPESTDEYLEQLYAQYKTLYETLCPVMHSLRE